MSSAPAAPPPPEDYVLMAMATMHAEGRLVEPEAEDKDGE